MEIKNLRRTSQIAFLAITLLGLVGITTTGFIYPYFFCYSCPWDVGACPLGIMEHGFIDIQTSFWVGMSMLLYLFGFLSLMGLMLGRAFCGWVCPIGTLQDLSRKLGISKIVNNKLKPNVDSRWKHVKFLMLLAVPVTAFLSQELFYTALCPVGGITGTLPTLTFYSSEWLLGSGFPVKLTSMILFTILIILVTRGWCKYLCPVGAYLAPWNWVSSVGLVRNKETCKNCNVCDTACPMDIKQIGTQPDMECILCGRCVDSCKFGSLKLKVMPFKNQKMAVLWVVLLLISGTMMAAGVMLGGYERTDEINSIPCLGCLALDPNVVNEWYVAEGPQPTLVTDILPTQPVFLHYRTDVCSGCDEMEPHIAILEEAYGDEIEFIHINLDHATVEEDASYDVYDFAGTSESRFGVPMFTTIIVEMNGTEPEIIYNTQYGSSRDQGESKRIELEESLVDALARHVITDSPIGPIVPSDAIVFSELFVDTVCTNCFKSEDALVELELEGQTNYVSYVTNADGISGNYSSYRELYYQGIVTPHPWTMIAGGPGELAGALTTEEAYDNHLAEIQSATLVDINLTMGGEIISNAGTMETTVSIGNPDAADQDIFIEGFLIERSSRWLNEQHHPIPNAFVDLLINDTYTVSAETILDISIFWNGTDVFQFTDFRPGNLGLIVVAWQDDVQITSYMIVPEGQDELYLVADQAKDAALPNNTAEFSFTLFNYLDNIIQVNLSVDKPVNWGAELSQTALNVPSDSSMTFDLTVTGNTTWNGQVGKFKVHAVDVTDPTIQTFTTIEVEVKDDITPPEIYNPTHEPPEPVPADQQIAIEVLVGDLSTLESVDLSYFSCTPQACSPYFLIPMNTTDGNSYTAEAYPLGLDHTDFHYRIIATDSYGNENITEFYEIELEPVAGDDHHTGEVEIDTRPKWIGVVLLCGIAIAALAIVMTSRNKPGKEDDKVPEDCPTEVEAEPVQEAPKPEIDKNATRARIQKAFDEGRITEAQYNNNMEKFRD